MGWPDKVIWLNPIQIFPQSHHRKPNGRVEQTEKLLSPGHRQILFLLAQESNNVNQVELNLNVAPKSRKLLSYDFEGILIEIKQ